jgi:Spy/CpxP family protein refolding chaperone
MRRFPRWTVLALALVTLGLALPSLAQDAPDTRRPVRHHFRACLSILDLTEEQEVAILGILEAARPALADAAAAVHTARESLRAALDVEPPDACAVGSATLAVQAAVEALRQERDAVQARVVATLTPEQQDRFEGCLAAPRRPVLAGTDEAAE